MFRVGSFAAWQARNNRTSGIREFQYIFFLLHQDAGLTNYGWSKAVHRRCGHSLVRSDWHTPTCGGDGDPFRSQNLDLRMPAIKRSLLQLQRDISRPVTAIRYSHESIAFPWPSIKNITAPAQWLASRRVTRMRCNGVSSISVGVLRGIGLWSRVSWKNFDSRTKESDVPRSSQGVHNAAF